MLSVWRHGTMIDVTTEMGFPIGPAISFGDFAWLWSVVAFAIVVGSVLVLWLFRARGTDETSIDVRPGFPRRPVGVARRVPTPRGERR
jgi:hypothetical protein